MLKPNKAVALLLTLLFILPLFGCSAEGSYQTRYIYAMNTDVTLHINAREDVTPLLDECEDMIGNYLVKLNTKELSEEQTRQTSKFHHAISNLERILENDFQFLQFRNFQHLECCLTNINHVFDVTNRFYICLLLNLVV